MVEMKTDKQYIKKYSETTAVIGKGSEGKICLVKQKKTKHVYAVKILRTPNKSRKNLARKEYSIMAKLHHKNIIMLVDAFDLGSLCLLVME